MTHFKKALPFLLVVLASLLIWRLGFHHYLTLASLAAHQKMLGDFLHAHYALALVAFMVTYVIVVALSLPVATVMTLTGGFLFGQMVGTGAVVVAATLGSCAVFLSARVASTDLLDKRLGAFGARMKKGFEENALSYLLTLRLIPLFPFVVVNLAAAFFQMRFYPYLFGTLVGILPGSFVYVSIGVSLRDVIKRAEVTPQVVLAPSVLISLVGLGILSLAPILYKRLKKRD